jgi:dihydropyrimidinase
MSILIKSGTIITAAERFRADVLVEGERITRLDVDIQEPADQIIDATGKLIMPGGVDPHTHFDLPMSGTVSSDDHYTGHKAAAFGGTTTVIDFVSQGEEDLENDVSNWHARADKMAAIDFGFHMNITRFDESIGSQIPGLVDLGITTLKVFTAYNNRLRLHDGEIFQVLRIAKQHGLLVMLHAENGDVIELLTSQAIEAGETKPIWHALTRPSWGAIEATLRAIALAAQAEAPIYIVHLNVAGEADMIDYARKRGLQVMGETCLQYLFFTEDHLRRPDGAKWVCSPPLRRSEDNLRLWEALSNGTIVTVGTDHCPFFYDGTQPILYEGKPVRIPGKELGKDDFTRIPNGVPGVGDRLPILWTYGVRQGRLSPNQFVAITSTNPAKIFGLYPKKGAILPGSDADIVIWDPEKHISYGVAHAHHRTDYNLFEGWELVGYPDQVFLRGKLIVNRGEWLGHPGMGNYVPRLPGAIIL